MAASKGGLRMEVIAPDNRKIKLTTPPKSLTALRTQIKLTFALKPTQYKIHYVDSDQYKCMIHNNETYLQALDEFANSKVLQLVVEHQIVNVKVGREENIKLKAGSQEKYFSRSIDLETKSTVNSAMINGQKSVHAAEIAKIVAHEARHCETQIVELSEAWKETAKAANSVFKGRRNTKAISYADGKYEGETQGNKPSGLGVKIMNNEISVRGEWRLGFPVRGACIYGNGSQYFGEFKEEELSGRGMLVYANGQRYFGEFARSDKNGKGVYYWKNEDRYEGEWLDNNISGYGIAYYLNGDRYEGEWKNGLKNGFGRYTYSDGRIYDGPYVNHKRHGEGVFGLTTGHKFREVWNNGNKITQTLLN